MDLFHVIEDGAAILRRRGAFKQVKVFARAEHVYAEVSKGTYVRLLQGGRTSVPDVSWLDVEGPGISIGRSGAPVVDAYRLAA